MADDYTDIVTVYLTTLGLPARWMTKLTRGLVEDKLAATATVYERRHADGGAEVLAALHTRRDHVSAITSRAFGTERVAAFSLDCDSRYRAWVLDSTSS
ncbi:hypothetical protein GZH49_25015 [Nocardia terpenica]|uniref:hypothetical protein n=1 Tax=Nocardia terpenica TaxID=455432 RepID=UPI002FE34029